MEVSRKLLSSVFVLVLMLVATEMAVVAEARWCESASQRFKGLCVRPSNCINVCKTEGFPGGKCRGVRRRCFCTTPCRQP